MCTASLGRDHIVDAVGTASDELADSIKARGTAHSFHFSGRAQRCSTRQNGVAPPAPARQCRKERGGRKERRRNAQLDASLREHTTGEKGFSTATRSTHFARSCSRSCDNGVDADLAVGVASEQKPAISAPGQGGALRLATLADCRSQKRGSATGAGDAGRGHAPLVNSGRISSTMLLLSRSKILIDDAVAAQSQ